MLSRNLLTWHTKARSYQCSIPFLAQWNQSAQRQCVRYYATPRDDGDRSQHGVFMGTVAARAPGSTRVADLLSQIKPQALGKPPRSNENPSLLALLVTPSFAKHALDTDFPLRVLQRFHTNPTTSKPLDAIVAVVDRLPVPGNAPDGVEGIGYALITDPVQSHTESQLPLQPNASKPGSISFDILTESRQGPRHISAQMPLAQTIFSTGMPSTLVYTRYQFEPLSGQLRKQASQRLESASLPLPNDITKGTATLKAPLLPLTLPRLVVSSMGNIVRKLSALPASPSNPEHGQAVSPKVFSASQELEAAVSSYFAIKDMSPEPVQVWALIIPEANGRIYKRKTLLGGLLELDADSLQQRLLDPSCEPISQGGLLGALQSGARLCKVLSGGGGWGKKAGLLSLDPDWQYSTRELRGDQGWNFTFEGDTTEEMMAAGRKQALGQIVKEGESIVFCLLGPKEHLRSPGTDSSEVSPAIVLGALPPSTENEQSSTESLQTSNDTPSLAHHPGHFGALCEGGMALNVSQQGKSLTQTKADAPYTTLTTYCLPQEGKDE